jgi:hypothetical protein
LEERHDGAQALWCTRKPMEEESLVSPAETLERGSVPSKGKDLEVECVSRKAKQMNGKEGSRRCEAVGQPTV